MSNQIAFSFVKLILIAIFLSLIAMPIVTRSVEEPISTDLPGVSTAQPYRLTTNTEPAMSLEFIPFRGVIAATEQGSTKVVSIEIVNRAAKPFDVTGIENTSSRFTAQLEAIEPGQRYRLTVTFEARGPEGKVAELLYLETNQGRISIPVHTAVIPRVYTFPRVVDMGKFPVSDIRLNPETARTAAQILMVYRKNTTGFEIKVTSDVPFLKIKSEQGPAGDRWENTIWLDSEHVEPGEIKGTIFIETNDSEVPKLEVPVTGLILKW